jgi:Lon-like protease
MKRSSTPAPKNSLPRLRWGLSWLIVLPVTAWGVSTIYLPLFSDKLSQTENWAVTAVIIVCMALSLLLHLLGHVYVARLTQGEAPEALTIFLFGDAAQAWAEGSGGWSEILAAAAGPVVSMLLTGLGYLLWNAQINTYFNLVTLFLYAYNGWLFLINLLPAFPMDGGRVMRAGLHGLKEGRLSLTTLVRRIGFGAVLALLAWAAFLYLQNARFSAETAEITAGLAVVLLDGLWPKPAATAEVGSGAGPAPKARPARYVGTVLLGLVMLGGFASTLMINNGLDAPGVALSVEPMVNVPAQYRHTHTGTFILTTVFSHAPILVGEWMLAQVDHAMLVVAPEVVVPKNTTVQEQARQDYQMLDDSEATAITVGLRLAGYQSEMVGKGVRVASILPESHANGILQVGDVITGINNAPVETTQDLIDQVHAQTGMTPVQLDVTRGSTQMMVSVKLIPPATSTDTPKIGIGIESAGFDFKPPFPVSIETQKINGGPSAGLMFTLTVYNALSPQDLTGGRKIAGTGTINLDGTVGPIGGVKQKVAAAEATGARYFLCPVDNYDDAVSVARTIKVIKVATVQDALDFLHSLPAQ